MTQLLGLFPEVRQCFHSRLLIHEYPLSTPLSYQKDGHSTQGDPWSVLELSPSPSGTLPDQETLELSHTQATHPLARDQHLGLHHLLTVCPGEVWPICRMTE